MKILYVEDNALDADLARRALMRATPPIEVEVLTSQQSALARLLQDPGFDLVLSDLHLPDGTGLEIIAFLREQHILIPVVIMTGNGDEAVAVAAIKAGAVDYVVKHGDYLNQLPDRLISAMEHHRAEMARREHVIQVLYVENDPADIELTRRFLARSAPHIRLQTVQSANEVLDLFQNPAQARSREAFDVLLLDYRLPEMTALDLMKELRRIPGMEIPMVLVTGQGSEETAVQALRLGAVDYMVKNTGYLRQLPAVLENAFYKAELIREREALKRSEKRYRELAENAQDIVYRVRTLPRIAFEYISPSIKQLTGFTPEEHYDNADLLGSLIHPDDRETYARVLRGEWSQSQMAVVRSFNRDGRMIWTEHRTTQIRDMEGRVVAVEGIARDVTERVQYESELESIAAVSAALRMAPTKQEMLPGVLEKVLEITRSDGAMITLIDQSLIGREVVIELGGGLYADKTGMRLPYYQSISGYVISQNKIYVTDDPQHDPHLFYPGFLGEIDALAAVPLNAKDATFGALLVGRSVHGRITSPQFSTSEINLLAAVADALASAIQRANLFESLQRSNEELYQAYDATIEGWSKALDLRDRETENHTQRVTEMTLRLASAVGIPAEEMPYLRWGALLHDIGKLGVPDAILHKPGPLDENEWTLMKLHPDYAYQLLSPIRYLRSAIQIPYCHHEKWDGSGYPRGLKGDEIPLGARMFSIIDVWEAITSDRPYRKAWSREQAVEYIRTQTGRQFDPQIVSRFLETFIDNEA